MSDVGYVHIYRSLIGHPAFRNDAEAMAFAWMVLRAAWRPVRVRYKERAVSLLRGQLSISVRDMASALDRDKAWVERLWKRLKSETMIETASETGVSIVTICNYDEFQPNQDSGETPNKTPRKTQARQGQDTEQRREKGNKEPNGSIPPTPLDVSNDAGPDADLVPDVEPSAPAKRRSAKPVPAATSRITDDWLPAPLPASVLALVELWPPGRLEREVEQFRDYWLDRPERRPGWDRTFHNRIRDIHDRVLRETRHDRSPNTGRQPASPRGGDGWTQGLDLIDDALARQRAGDTSWAA